MPNLQGYMCSLVLGHAKFASLYVYLSARSCQVCKFICV